MTSAAKLNSQQQEDLILDAAAKCIEASSLLDFTMAAIAKEAKLSMGSIYKNVLSKEDVLVAIATRTMAHQHNVFSTILNLPLTTPERLVCTVLISPQNLHLYSFGVHLDMLTSNEALLQRASARWLEKLARIEQSTEALFKDLFTQAWNADELTAPEQARDQTIEMLMVGIWSLSVGFTQVAYQRQAHNSINGASNLPYPLPTDHALIKNMQNLINTYAWATPLTDDGIVKAKTLLEQHGYR